jgi:hypothetical protein
MADYRRPHASSNTKWPGASRHAVYLPPLSILLALAQLILGALFFRKLWHFSHTSILCTNPDVDGPMMKYPPLTIAALIKHKGSDKNVGFTPQFSLGEAPSDASVILSCIVLPIVVLLASIYSTTRHFWSRRGQGLTPGRAAINGTILLGGWALVWFHDRLTRVDHARVVETFPECGVEGGIAAGLAAERRNRVRVAMGKDVGICLGVFL